MGSDTSIKVSQYYQAYDTMSGYQLHLVIINVARVKHVYLLYEANTKLGGDVYVKHSFLLFIVCLTSSLNFHNIFFITTY